MMLFFFILFRNECISFYKKKANFGQFSQQLSFIAKFIAAAAAFHFYFFFTLWGGKSKI